MSRYLAIDIDSQGLFVVAGSTRGGAARVEHALAWADDAAPPPPLTAETAKAVGEQLRDRLKAAGVPAAPVLVAVGRDKVIPKEVRHPAVPPADEPAIVRFQALKEVTENPDDVILDYAPLANGVADPSAERRAMVVVLRKEVFAAVQAMCTAAGLKLAAVTPRPFAVAAGITRAMAAGTVVPPDNPADAVAVLTPGPQGGEFTVVRGGSITFTRSVPAPSLASEVLLVNEVRRNLTIYAGQNPGHPVRAVYVAEADGAVGGWAARLRTGLTVPVHSFDPLAGAAEGVPPQTRGRFAGAAGLLAGRAADALPINFAAPRQPRTERDPKRKQLVIAAAVAGVLLLGGFGFGYAQLSAVDEQLRNLQTQKANLDDELARMDPDAKRLEAVDQWAAREVVWLDEWYDLSDRLPAGDTVRLLSFTARARPVDKNGKQDAQASVDLRFGAKNADAATAFVSAFDKDNVDKARYYLMDPKRTAGTANGSVVHNILYTVSGKVNHRPPEKYTRFMNFPPPYRRGSGPGTVIPDEFDILDGQ